MARTVERAEVTVPGSPRQPGRRPLFFAALGTVIAGVLAIVLFVGVGSGPGTPDVAPGINQQSAYLLRLDVFGSSGGAPAPNFTLTDQHGQSVSLAQFRGKSVVLSFTDDQCTDICTLLAQDVRTADRDLGAARRNVVFLSVNANPYFPGVGTLRTWTDQHGLSGLHNWVFVSGTPAQLRQVWRDYGVEVELQPKTRTVIHSTELYFLGPTGHQIAVGSYGSAAADTAVYGHALAQMADDDLPASDRASVAGPSAQAPNESSAAIGAKVPAFALPVLGGHGTLRSSSLAGRYSVLNFWSSTCTACVREMPAIEQSFRDLGARVNFLGVDVADHGSAARFAHGLGVTYPLVSDASGTVAASYQIADLPFTAIISPQGYLKVLHPGTFTVDQLEYVVEQLDPSLVKGS